MSQSTILEFYRGNIRDSRGRTIEDVQAQNTSELEEVHDYIQWMFPLTEKSAFNPTAPILRAEDIRTFRDDSNLRRRLIASLQVMLHFYGLQLDTNSDLPSITFAPTFDARASSWITIGNHNYLRITRILRSLALLGESAHAKAFLTCLEDIFARFPTIIGDRTPHFWTEALRAG